jgi:hypothetical protein
VRRRAGKGVGRLREDGGWTNHAAKVLHFGTGTGLAEQSSPSVCEVKLHHWRHVRATEVIGAAQTGISIAVRVSE